MKRSIHIAVVVCSLAFCAAAQTPLTIRVAAEAVVAGETVTLGEVARITGDAEKTLRVKAISLGYAPNVGMTREISAEKIKLSILAAGFSPGGFSLNGPSVCRLRRAGQEISQSKLRETVEQAVRDQFADGTVDARIVRRDLPARIEVPLGKIDLRAKISGVQNIFSPFTLSVEIRVNDIVIRRLPLNVEIEAFGSVLVAAKDLAADGKIIPADTRLEKRRLVKPQSSYLRDTEKLRGSRLIKNLAAGMELTTDLFVAAVVIRSGDTVRIVGKSGNLQISVSGEARANGKIGDRISVKNSQSGAVIQATVVDEGLVKVFF